MQEELEIEELPSFGRVELGDLVIRPAPRADFKVVDVGGRPIPGATVRESIRGNALGFTSDARGRVEMPLAGGAVSQVRVWSPEHRMAEIEVRANAASPQLLVLERGLRLSLIHI